MTKWIAALAALLLTAPTIWADEAALPDREQFHLFLLAGQSNMAGRGEIDPEDLEPHPRVLALNEDGEWQPAVDPLHWDKPGAPGVGLGRAFAIALAEADPEITIGLIPAACGGSPIHAWEPGYYYAGTKSHPYDDAIARTERALKDGVLRGILWHQGESECGDVERAAQYEERMVALMAQFRDAFDAPELPFIIGQLSPLWKSKSNEAKTLVNAAHLKVAEDDPHAAWVSAEGFTMKADKVHFDAASLREFGQRYAEAYLELTAK